MNEYWQEDIKEVDHWQFPSGVIDLSFRLKGKTIPVDHAWQLSQSISRQLPWFMDEQSAALHLIHVAESANGWQRPEGENAVLHMSHRTRLQLRLPFSRVQDAQQLVGKLLQLGTEPIEIAECKIKSLSKSTTLFARYLDMQENVDESLFLKRVQDELKERGIFVRKMLCGRMQKFKRPSGVLTTRSLMLADLHISDSVKLQQTGLGGNRKMGCGLFIAHKGIDAVSEQQHPP